MNDSFPSIQPPTMSHLGVAFLTWRRYLQQAISKHGITLKQLFVLRRLTGVAFLYPSEIAAFLFCDRPTATVIINNMRRYGWIESRKHPQNRKFVQISITSAGQEKLDEINASTFSDMPTLFDPLACFEKNELAIFDSLLNKLNTHLKQITKEEQNE